MNADVSGHDLTGVSGDYVLCRGHFMIDASVGDAFSWETLSLPV